MIFARVLLVGYAAVGLAACDVSESSGAESQSIAASDTRELILLSLVESDEGAACTRRFESAEWALEEDFCDGSAGGVMLFKGGEIYARYPWYDEEFSRWSLAEGCEPGDCSYGLAVTAAGKIDEIRASFAINLSVAEYRLIPQGEELEVTERVVEDLPS